MNYKRLQIKARKIPDRTIEIFLEKKTEIEKSKIIIKNDGQTDIYNQRNQA